jgi:hypothetical protein
METVRHTEKLLESFERLLGNLGRRLGFSRIWVGLRSVWANLNEMKSDTDVMFKTAYAWVLQKGIANFGDRFIVTAGVPKRLSGSTNILKVVELSQNQYGHTAALRLH